MIFIDTSAFIARHRQGDQWHSEALRGWGMLKNLTEPLFTTNLVIAETARFLLQNLGASRASREIGAILRSRGMNILRSSLHEELEAVTWMRRYVDQQMSFVDCVSFVLMKRNGIRKAFAFDRHFWIAGFEPWLTPGQK